MIKEQFEFIDTLKENNGVLMITIPSKLVNFLDLKKGDPLKVQFEKPNSGGIKNEN